MNSTGTDVFTVTNDSGAQYGVFKTIEEAKNCETNHPGSYIVASYYTDYNYTWRRNVVP